MYGVVIGKDRRHESRQREGVKKDGRIVRRALGSVIRCVRYKNF